MPRVDFYLLSESGDQARLRYVCRLAEKAAALGHRVFVRTSSSEESASLDELLWTYSDKVFLPHEVGSTPSHPLVKVLVHEHPPSIAFDVLINLAHHTSSPLPEVKRIAEVIPADDASKRAGRERYRFYRDQGCTLETHEV